MNNISGLQLQAQGRWGRGGGGGRIGTSIPVVDINDTFGGEQTPALSRNNTI